MNRRKWKKAKIEKLKAKIRWSRWEGWNIVKMKEELKQLREKEPNKNKRKRKLKCLATYLF